MKNSHPANDEYLSYEPGHKTPTDLQPSGYGSDEPRELWHDDDEAHAVQ